jgi:hypothetical protein
MAKEVKTVQTVSDLQAVVHATILKTPGYTFVPSAALYAEINDALEKFKNDKWVQKRTKDIKKYMHENPVAPESKPALKTIEKVQTVQDLQDFVSAAILKKPGYTFTPSAALYAEITTTLDKFKDNQWVKNRRKDIETYIQNHPITPPTSTIPKELCARVNSPNMAFDEELSQDLQKIKVAMPSMKQHTVVRQSNTVGGQASCGYHALKNGIYIARAIMGIDPWESLQNATIVHNLFGTPQSTWRSIIIRDRNHIVLKNYILRKLKDRFMRTETQIHETTPWVRTHDLFKIREIYASAFPEIAGNAAQAIIDTGKPSTIEAQTIINTIKTRAGSTSYLSSIKKELESYAQDKNPKLIPGTTPQQKANTVVNYVTSINTMKKYLNLDGAALTFSAADIPVAMNTYTEIGTHGIASGGDNLNMPEIEKLGNLEKQPGKLLDPAMLPEPVAITVIDAARIDSAALIDLKSIVSRCAKEPKYINIFCVRKLDHWVTLVLRKHDTNVEYFTANSTNGDANPYVIPVVHVLEVMKICLE